MHLDSEVIMDDYTKADFLISILFLFIVSFRYSFPTVQSMQVVTSEVFSELYTVNTNNAYGPDATP